MYNPIVDFGGDFVENNLPIHKRLPKYLAWAKGLLSGFARCNEIFRKYIIGFTTEPTYPYFLFITTYSEGAIVIYNKKIYKSLKDSNDSNAPDSNLDWWQEISPSAIGVQERANFRANRLIFEYALNRYFRQELIDNGFSNAFKQPDSDLTPTHSSIYIRNVVPTFISFLSFPTEDGCSLSFPDGSTGWSFPDTVFSGQSPYYISINIPSTVYSTIGIPEIADKIIGNFVKKYITSGIGFIITPY